MSQDENKKVVANKRTTAIKDTKTKSSSTTKKNSAKKKSKKNKKMDTATKIIIVGIFIIAIPCCILGAILIDAAMQTGEVISGDRFDGDLDPAITDVNIENITNKTTSLGGVENVTIELPVATLRVYVDTTDSITSDELQKLADSVYDVVVAELPENTYFAQDGTKKMYDIEIHVYNSMDKKDDDSFIYAIQSKSSSMDKSIIRLVSEPMDEELAKRLLEKQAEKDNPTPPEEDNITSGGEGEEVDDGEVEDGKEPEGEE